MVEEVSRGGEMTTQSASAVADPAVAFTTEAGVAVATAAAQTVSRIDDVNVLSYSLLGTSFAYHRRVPHPTSPVIEKAFGFDTVTGAQTFHLNNATCPVLFDQGRKVAFLPDNDGQRDPQVNSVWMREQDGTVRKIVQFSNGPGLPGVSTDVSPGGVFLPEEVVFDAQGTTIAVTEGFMGRHDVWVVDVQTGTAHRATTGKRSHLASLTPDGRVLAVVRDHTECGPHPPPGVPHMQAGDIQTMGKDGTDKQTLIHGTCAQFYSEPRWVSADRLVAARVTRHGAGSGHYRRDLVAIDAHSGQVTVLVETGDLEFFTVSPSRQMVAYVRSSDKAAFSLLDLQAGTTTRFSEGLNPNVAGNPKPEFFS
jgi:hypothetical protein